MGDKYAMKLFEIVKSQKQLLLTGGHGVGKTYYAKRVSELLTNRYDGGIWGTVSGCGSTELQGDFARRRSGRVDAYGGTG